jgi:hypothetical protein
VTGFELERLVDQALERELAQLVEQRLAARNGAPEQVRQVVPPAAVKTCRVCAKSTIPAPKGAV